MNAKSVHFISSVDINFYNIHSILMASKRKSLGKIVTSFYRYTVYIQEHFSQSSIEVLVSGGEIVFTNSNIHALTR